LKKPTFNGNYLLDMFVFTLVDNMDMEHVVPFYYRAKRLGINNCFNFVFKDKEVYKTVKMMRLKTNIHLHERLNESFLDDTLTHPQQILFIDVKENLVNPVLMNDYETYLQKNEGNFYTLPSCGLTTTKLT